MFVVGLGFADAEDESGGYHFSGEMECCRMSSGQEFGPSRDVRTSSVPGEVGLTASISFISMMYKMCFRRVAVL